MKLTFTREEETFRDEVRSFLDQNLTAGLRAYASRMTSVYSSKPVALEWQRILVKQRALHKVVQPRSDDRPQPHEHERKTLQYLRQCFNVMGGIWQHNLAQYFAQYFSS
jgi:hypothetical protein